MSSCVLVGESVLLLQCAALLRRRSFRVEAVISEDPGVQAWAEQAGVRLCRRIGDAERFLAGHRYAWLFSIVNPYVLGPAVLACAEHGAINYHDSLLPRYSGSHAVPWALVQGERQVGVSWHVMGQRADAGNLLAQTVVPVSETETAQSLNGKCAVAAIGAFGKVLKQLAAPLTSVPQETAQRSFFYRFRRPTPAAVVDFRQPAQAVVRFVRALSFGSQLNPLGLAKLLADGHVRVVDRAEVVVGQGSDRAPGTCVARTSEHQLQVATLRGDVVLTLRPADLESSAAGDRVQLDADAWAALEAFDRSVFKHERHWLNLFRDRPRRLTMRGAKPRARRWLVRGEVAHRVAACARILRALGTTSPGATVDLWGPVRTAVPEGVATALYATVVPVLAPPEDLPERDAVADLEASLATNAASGTYLRDLEDRLLVAVPAEALAARSTAVELRLNEPCDPPEAAPFAVCIGRGRGDELWLAAYEDLAEPPLRDALRGRA